MSKATVEGTDEQDLRRQNWVLQCHLAETRHALKQARDELDRMLQSRSWKLTRGLRAGLDRVRHIFRQAAPQCPSPVLRKLEEFAPPLERDGCRQLLVDVTELAIQNLQGGIQHTVKGILSEWLLAPPVGWTVIPVQLTREGTYVSATGDLGHLFGPFNEPLAHRRLEMRSGDVFIGLDLMRDHADLFRVALKRLRERGVHCEVVLYDLLPVDLPDCVPDHINRAFQAWLAVVADEADGVACISQTVADRFARWLERSPRRGVAISSFRLGVPELGLPSVGKQRGVAGKSFLMVGTIEPRKGYVDALDAFDSIWASASGEGVTLTIVGRYGWGMPAFLERLEQHRELGKRLHWLRTATDSDVHASYESADALLFCSRGEGFGLPIVEAAQHRLPMILRDLPEFREVAGDGAFFFTANDGGGVSAAIREWMRLDALDKAPQPCDDIAISWRESARELLSLLPNVFDTRGRSTPQYENH